MPKKEIVAMILAGGRGTRLGVLTEELAKPAVSFGGEFRIIDFTLSNCSNSDIETVGVLTQYKPHVLNSYIGIGSSWDLDRRDGGVTLLPPYVKKKKGGGEWYKGTANAVYQNTEFIDQYDPEYVLILSGDHIYKMDYSLMLDYHKEKKADATIAVIEVPWEEANRFGLMETNENNKITGFQEKPEEPESNLASMGVYIFNWDKLKNHLSPKEDSIDFGGDIVPRMVKEDLELFAYQFKGYWKDVGTIKSYWEAHMDLIKENPDLDLYDRSWRIHPVNPHRPPQYVSNKAEINTSLINKGTTIHGKINKSIIFFGTEIRNNTQINKSVIMPHGKINQNTEINKSIICSDVEIGENCDIGIKGAEENEITVISSNLEIPDNTSIKKGEIVRQRDLEKKEEKKKEKGAK